MKSKYLSKFCLILLLCISFFSTKAICICEQSFEENTSKATTIFIGKVIGCDKDRFWLRGKPKSVYTFQVYESFKGLSQYIGIISVIAPIGGCESAYFSNDSLYLVMAYNNSPLCDVLWTNDCSYYLLSKKRDLIKKLGTPTKHINPYDTENSYNQSILENAFLTETLTSRIAVLEQEIKTIKTDKQQRDYFILVLGAIILTLVVYLVRVRRKYYKNI